MEITIMVDEKTYRIAVNEGTNDKLLALQALYKEKYGKFISLGNLINLILTLPNFIKSLKDE